jgi:trehalose-6-phosphatase
MKPLYIFDLDGTLAHIEHRKHMLEDKYDPNRWRRFYAACDKDAPCAAVINTMNSLRIAGCEVWIFSGRSSEVREKTVAWLCEHTVFTAFELEVALTMRDEGDYTVDDELKLSWLKEMTETASCRCGVMPGSCASRSLLGASETEDGHL